MGINMDEYDLKVILEDIESRNAGTDSASFVVISSLWNSSGRKMCLIIHNAYAINLKKQHAGVAPDDHLEANIAASIHSGSHMIKGDGFKIKICRQIISGIHLRT